MEFIDKEDLARILRAFEDELRVLQIKVAALESIVLPDDGVRAEYSKLVSAEAEMLMRERGNRPIENSGTKSPDSEPK